MLYRGYHFLIMGAVVSRTMLLLLSISGRKTMFFLGPKASPIANIVYTELDFRTRPSSEGT